MFKLILWVISHQDSKENPENLNDSLHNSVSLVSVDFDSEIPERNLATDQKGIVTIFDIFLWVQFFVHRLFHEM